MILRWFFSRTVRQAANLRRHIQKTVHAQRDRLSAEALAKIAAAIAAVRAATASRDRPDAPPAANGRPGKGRGQVAADLSARVGERKRGSPPGGRQHRRGHSYFFFEAVQDTDRIDAADALRITADDLRDRPNVEIPTGLNHLFDYWINGNSHYYKVAETDGIFEAYEPPRMVVPFLYKQRFRIGGAWYTLWSPWTDSSSRRESNATISIERARSSLKSGSSPATIFSSIA